jgi:alkylation response protein AidB-like acyl-CoA dehydrogenase
VESDVSHEREFFLGTTERFLSDKVDVTTLRRLRHDERGHDDAYWRQGCQLGWTSSLVGEDDGGGSVSGEGVSDLALVAFAFGRHAAPGPLVTANVVASTISRSGSPEQKREVLQGILSGDLLASWAFSERRPSGGFGTVAMRATRAGDGWSLSGTKLPVEAGGTAQCFLVTAQTDEGLTQYLVPSDTPGLTVTPMDTIDLTRRFAVVHLEDVIVPASAVIGAVGEAHADVQRQLQLANTLQCAEMVGAMDRAMEITVEWSFNRYSFGRPLASYQVLKHRFADMKVWLEASHALTDAAVRAVQHNAGDADEMVSAAKAYIGQYGPELCQECVQMHGGIALTFDHDLHLYLRRVSLDAVLFGTVTDHRLRLAEILEDRADGEAAA